MTNEEAIEILNEERDYAQFPKYVKEAIEIATSAIKKQIPKKPIKHYFYDRYYAVDYFYQCPNHCNDRFQLSNTYSFCPNCGQALDWSDIE